MTDVELAVVLAIGDGERSGEFVRKSLRSQGRSLRLAEFYTMMRRLEKAGIVNARSELVRIGGYLAAITRRRARN